MGCLRFSLDRFWGKNLSNPKLILLAVCFDFGWLIKKNPIQSDLIWCYYSKQTSKKKWREYYFSLLDFNWTKIRVVFYSSIPKYKVFWFISHKLRNVINNIVWKREIMSYFTKLFFINCIRKKIEELKEKKK
jgi:hypothetical protein